MRLDFEVKGQGHGQTKYGAKRQNCALWRCPSNSIVFTARAYARAVLGVVFLSIRPSVCLSHAWIVTKLNDALRIFWYHTHTERQSLCYSGTDRGWSATPPFQWHLRSKWLTPFEKRRFRPISHYNVSTVRDSEKSSMMTNRNLTTGFPTSYTWSTYVTLSLKRVAQKAIFSFWEI